MSFLGQFQVCIMTRTSQCLFETDFTLQYLSLSHTHTVAILPARLNRMLSNVLATISSQEEKIPACASRTMGLCPILPSFPPHLCFFPAFAGKPSCRQTTGWTVASCFITVLARSPHEKYFSWKINYNMSKWCLTKLNRRHAALLQIHPQSLGRETNKSTSSKSVTETQENP